MDFDHLVLTRFSAVRRPGLPPLPEDWLRYRLGFFYDACYASLTSQRGADFRWLVFLDDRCPAAFRDEIEELAAGAFEAVWGHEGFHQVELPRAVTQAATRPWLITTRVDSDDAVAHDFVAAVQRQFARQDRLYVNFTRGLQVDRTGAVYRRDQPSGPFLSLIARRIDGAPPVTVFATKHERARSMGPLREVRAEPMWLQVVHDANLRTIVVGPRVAPSVVATRFEISLPYRAELGRSGLLRAKAAHRLRLVRQWWSRPGELVRAAEAATVRLRGTHTRPVGDPSPWADRLLSTRLGRRVGVRRTNRS